MTEMLRIYTFLHCTCRLASTRSVRIEMMDSDAAKVQITQRLMTSAQLLSVFVVEDV